MNVANLTHSAGKSNGSPSESETDGSDVGRLVVKKTSKYTPIGTGTRGKNTARRGKPWNTPGKTRPKKTDQTEKPAEKPTRPHRFRPGTVALREIRHYQKTTDLLIRRLPFARLVSNFEVHPSCRRGRPGAEMPPRLPQGVLWGTCSSHPKLANTRRGQRLAGAASPRRALLALVGARVGKASDL
jgi:hypothetical protein